MTTGDIQCSFTTTSALTCVAFSPVHDIVAAGCADGSVHLRSTKNGKGRVSWEIKPGSITAVQYTRCGGFVITGTSTGSIHVYDVASSRIRHSFKPSNRSAITAVTLAPTVNEIVIGFSSGAVVLYDYMNKERLNELCNHQSSIAAVDFATADEHTCECCCVN